MLLYGLSNWQFWLNGGYFILLAAVLLFVPGWRLLMITKIDQKLSSLTKFFLSPVLGMTTFAILMWLGGTLKFYGILYLYLIFAIGLTCYLLSKKLLRQKWHGFVNWWQKSWPIFLLIILGLVIQMPAIFSSGLRNEEGVRFFFTNNQDGLMHMGFINSLSKGFPPLRPEVNDALTDYHYFGDLLMAQFVRLSIPTINLFCQYMPFLISILTTGLLYQTVFFVTKKRSAAVLTTLVFLLAGDGGWLLNLFLHGGNGWAMASFDNGADQFLNLPFTLAKLIFLTAWLVLNYFWQQKNRQALIILLLLLIPLTLFKVYWLFFFIGGWGIALVIAWLQAWQQKKVPSGLILETGTAVFAIIISWLLLQTAVKNGDSLHFVWQVWPREIAAAHHLNWQNWFLREQVFVEAQNWPRLIIENCKLLAVALFFVFGVRLLGLWPSKKARKILNLKNWWFFYGSFFVWTFFGFNFLQTKGLYNTFNFLILAATALSFLLGSNLAVCWENKKLSYWRLIIVIVTFLFLIPRTFYNWGQYVQTATVLTNRGKLYDASFLELLNQAQLLTTTDDLLAVAPKSDYFIAASVIPGFIGRRTYLSNQFILASHTYDFSEKQEALERAWSAQNQEAWQTQLKDLGVTAVVIETVELKNLATQVQETLKPAFVNDAGVVILLDSEL